MMEIPITVFYEYHSQEKGKSKKAWVVTSKSLFFKMSFNFYNILYVLKNKTIILINFKNKFKNFTIKIT